ncbi:26S proteasome regulatory subunit [Haematococcus lacustris]
MAVLTEAQALLSRFKDSYARQDLKTAESLLGQLKVKLIQLPALPPVSQPSATAQQELALARDAMEHAAMLAVKLQDEAAAERAFVQLKVFYNDTRSALEPSSREGALIGLNLLRLLVANRIAEFHTELEVTPTEVQDLPEVASVIQLERWLMAGAYNKVLDTSKQPASDLHAALMTQLTLTVREEVASCMERAYKRLKLSDAQRMLMFDSPQATLDYCKKHEWSCSGDFITFEGAGAAASQSQHKEVPPLELINNTLVYAKELERIV